MSADDHTNEAPADEAQPEAEAPQIVRGRLTMDPARHRVAWNGCDVTLTVTTTGPKRVTPRPASAQRVAKAAAKMPGATVAQIAAKAGVSESTARRHLPAPIRTREVHYPRA